MRLYDRNEGRVINLPEIYRDFTESGEEEGFKVYACNLLEDTLKGRNDCEVVGLLPEETKEIIRTIVSSLN